MTHNLQPIRSNDNHGKIFLSDDHFIRFVDRNHFSEIKKTYSLYQNEFEKLGIVETELIENQNEYFLKHTKYPISYPFEWTCNQFKDALLYHFYLIESLDKYDYTLKDALPDNIVFNFTDLKFVDYLSIIQKKSIQKEQWLIDLSLKHGLKNHENTILISMLFPYMLIPFTAFFLNKYQTARKILSTKYCNMGHNSPTIHNLIMDFDTPFEFKKSLLFLIKNIFPFRNKPYIKTLKYLNQIKNNIFNYDPKININAIKSFIENTDITPYPSGYGSYYSDKKEDNPFNNAKDWNEKQKNIYEIIKSTQHKTLLDIGCNTGWYSIVAEKLGASVTSIDIDEFSIDSLYLKSKKEKLKINPLLIPFDQLDQPVLNSKNEISFLPPTLRLASDIVLCLGLYHHLVLSGICTEDKIFTILSKLTKNKLVLEFVDLEDALIKNHPDFFKKINQFSNQNYNLDLLLKIGLKYFKKFEINNSHPSTRKVVVFYK